MTLTLGNLGLDELRQQTQGLLPAYVASLDRDGVRKTFLHHRQLGAARDLVVTYDANGNELVRFTANTLPDAQKVADALAAVAPALNPQRTGPQ